MKKIALILATVVAALSLASCKCNKEQEPVTCEFNKNIIADHETVKQANPGHIVQLMEVQTVLVDTLTKVNPSDVKVAMATEVFRVGDKVVFVNRDYVNGSFEMTEQSGHWLGDVAINVNKTGDFDKAVKALFESGLNVPATTYMTLRNPLNATVREYPLYIFGSQNTHFVGVDAGTYAVEEFED